MVLQCGVINVTKVSSKGFLSKKLFRSYHRFGAEWEGSKSFAMLLLQGIIRKGQT